MTAARRERLTLTLPANPVFARLARLATLHFLRLQGVTALDARKGARAVEERSRKALRAAAGRGGARRMLALTCVSKARELQVMLAGGRAPLLVMPRPPVPEAVP